MRKGTQFYVDFDTYSILVETDSLVSVVLIQAMSITWGSSASRKGTWPASYHALAHLQEGQ